VVVAGTLVVVVGMDWMVVGKDWVGFVEVVGSSSLLKLHTPFPEIYFI